MRVKFIGSGYLGEYHRPGPMPLKLRPGDVADVPDELGERLLADFPGVFVADVAEPVVHRQIKEPVRRKQKH